MLRRTDVADAEAAVRSELRRPGSAAGWPPAIIATVAIVVYLAAGLGAMRPAAQGDDASAAAPAAVPTFDDFLAGVRAEARAHGVSERTITLALGSLSPDPLVVTRDRAQPELTDSLDDYVAHRLTPKTVAAGRAQLAQNRALLTRVAARLWHHTRRDGGHLGARVELRPIHRILSDRAGARDARLRRTPAALPDGTMAALAILDRGQVDPAEMKGSWAGAMGQPQFMPSSFLQHAVDFDGDGHIDIWSSPADVLGSMANFCAPRDGPPASAGGARCESRRRS